MMIEQEPMAWAVMQPDSYRVFVSYNQALVFVSYNQALIHQEIWRFFLMMIFTMFIGTYLMVKFKE